jgi:lipopolysaccharide heptosyltransferase II
MTLDPRWGAARRILGVRLDNLGDVLMTTPALRAIRRALPGAHLGLLTSGAGASLAPGLPWIDEFIVADVPWVKRTRPDAEPIGQAEAGLVQRLAAGHFDAAVIFTVCTQSALPAAMACRMAGIPLRLAHCRENPYELLSDWVRDTEQVQDGMRHEVERQLALASAVGFTPEDTRLQLQVTEADRAAVTALLAAHGVPPGRPYFVVHPGASAASRRYPADRFGEAARAVAAGSGCIAVFTGDQAEAGLVRHARASMRMPSVSLAGLLDVGRLAALIQASDLLLTNNTGPSHIAAAVGTPVVTLYALTNPQHHPWQVPSRVLSHEVPCRNCLKSVCPQGHHDCLLKVEPQAVAQAALDLMFEGVSRGAAA